MNLTDTIGHRKKVPCVGTWNDKNCYQMQQSYDKNSEDICQMTIHPVIIHTCRDAGLKWTRSQHHDGNYRKDRPRHPSVKNLPEQPISRERKTQLPIKCDGDTVGNILCTFKFCLFWDFTCGRWSLPHKQGGSTQHCLHMHINRSLLWLHTQSDVAPDQFQVDKVSLHSAIFTTATSSLVGTHNGKALEWHQVHYLKTKDKTRLLIVNDRSK